MLPEIAGLGRWDAVNFAIVSVTIIVKKRDLSFVSLLTCICYTYCKPIFYVFCATLLQGDSSAVLFLKVFPSERAFSNMNNVYHRAHILPFLTWQSKIRLCGISFAFTGAVYLGFNPYFWSFMCLKRPNDLRLFWSSSRDLWVLWWPFVSFFLSLRHLSRMKCDTSNMFDLIVLVCSLYRAEVLRCTLFIEDIIWI